MKKDIEWLKSLINEEGIVMDMHLLGRLDEQYWKNENIKINKGRLFYLIDQLDEPETLSQEWIDKNKVARIDNLRKMTTSDVVTVEKLKNLLVPKQDNGYDAEKEKLYTVDLPHSYELIKLLHTQTYHIKKYSESGFGDYTNTFTEAEIKAIDERYWAFAEEVTE
ncbi:DUF1642 domain-containing protein [Jeotgalibaca porci]|uniref:DUF1642 domain-containing protein n=1 Tax=Jeotgalibaca porci TaxID=1868793 RepID=UPI00359FB319